MGKDFVAELDLGSEQKINYLSLGALQNGSSWIYFPFEVIFEGSNDGKTFDIIGSSINEKSYREQGTLIQNFELQTEEVKYRYIKVTAKNIGITPEWHPSKFQPSWLFIDELIVK